MSVFNAPSARLMPKTSLVSSKTAAQHTGSVRHAAGIIVGQFARDNIAESNAISNALRLRILEDIERRTPRNFGKTVWVRPASQGRCGGGREVVIQQDGAGSHIKQDDPEFYEAVQEMGVSVRLLTQPPQSPDLNINDLALFASLASLMKRKKPKNQLELIDAVRKEFTEYCPTVLNKMWLTHKAVMNEILECDGGNSYKLPHLKKDQLIRQGRLPSRLQITTKSYATSRITRQNLQPPPI